MEEQQELVLADETINLLNNRGLWLIDEEDSQNNRALVFLPRRFKAYLWADLKGDWGIEHVNPKKDLTLKQIQKALVYLIKYDLIQPADWRVFPEFPEMLIMPEDLVFVD